MGFSGVFPTGKYPLGHSRHFQALIGAAHIEQKAYRIAQLRLAWRLHADVTAGFVECIAIGDGRVSILEKRAMNSEAQASNALFTSSKVIVRSKDAS